MKQITVEFWGMFFAVDENLLFVMHSYPMFFQFWQKKKITLDNCCNESVKGYPIKMYIKKA